MNAATEANVLGRPALAGFEVITEGSALKRGIFATVSLDFDSAWSALLRRILSEPRVCAADSTEAAPE